ncbi:MAG: HigA family addiction module antidote protein [Candidatus Marinimicrobia bacterium]|jgi:addiction module HigA family antidote|nr:HigA family addiction module antidote protein [Candidatus Neomarinimicrobiota bacterium]MBT3675120.1 HigA family addiction module antidote protein [Candidatus Neomarinimicrobiota bacterium]MBT3763528.1 HigA family addiction module antidote protein [Candidatus Neomarinimicrobiota bacterium]MBT4067583.1 HigA family addiction module antidote protein [Candidatus Neomarinimicrobiota bacterium]MBT4270352.1 HigA family addiction module antidote protein [Candidatus Neomarinimicrobiota bacterium]
MKNKNIKPLHPGEILLEEFLTPLGLSQNKISRDNWCPPRRINEIVLEKRRITADTALRLGRYFDMTPQFRLGLQMDYDLNLEIDRIVDPLDKEVKSYFDVS